MQNGKLQRRKSTSQKDYRYEILKFLFDKGKENIRPLIEEFVCSSIYSRPYFGTLLSNMMRVQGIIRVSNVRHLTSPDFDKDSSSELTAMMKPAGIKEYHTLHNLYTRQPVTRIHIVTHGHNSPVVGRDLKSDVMNLNIAPTENQKEIKIARKTLVWMIILGVLAVLVTIWARLW
jgi:hypothetical protein